MSTLLKMMMPIEEERFSDMYYRGGRNCGGKIVLSKGEAVTFDTYFNSFGQGSYKKHTIVEEIEIAITIKGSFCVQVRQAEGTFLRGREKKEEAMSHIASAMEAKEAILQEKECEFKEAGEIVLTQSLASVSDSGIIYIRIDSKEENGEVIDFEIRAKEQKKQEVKLAIVICTYKRERYVIENIDRIKADKQCNGIDIIVVDNGKTLGEIAGVKVIANENTGGSGGFTRGMIEANALNYTHFLLMDDDISFVGETILRTKRFMEYARDAERLTLGASMLVMGAEYLQYEKGAEWHGRGLSTTERGYDLRDRRAVIVNDNEMDKKDYTAWWYCCMSTKTLERIGKPMPFFIKGDDIEYGLRAKNEVVVNNGIGVWHESFDSKFSSVLSYYIRRNEMILNSIHLANRSVFMVIKDVVQAVGKQVVFHRYKTLEMVKMGVEDFLKGAEWFSSIDAENKHKELMSKSDKMYNKDELFRQGYSVETTEIYKGYASKLLSLITLNGYLIPKMLYPKQGKEWRKVSMTNAPISAMYMANKTVHYNEQTEQGFVSELRKKELFKSGLWLIKTSFKLLLSYGRLKEEYQAILTDKKNKGKN